MKVVPKAECLVGWKVVRWVDLKVAKKGYSLVALMALTKVVHSVDRSVVQMVGWKVDRRVSNLAVPLIDR